MDPWETSLWEQAERLKQVELAQTYLKSRMEKPTVEEGRLPHFVSKEVLCRLEECGRRRVPGGWYCAEHEGNLRSWTASMF